ncbi:actin monomer binding protein [Pyrenophora tritici-repentis]|nr:actin monomer binding protein [Pyrenophora tritici-repentis]KAG9384370.1 actin monomer binding protein [Pyrenophora tritici-repentis]KAI1559577.1 hypothetical protein PtrEW4_011666 [Pyrenophora tritici-repentis]KAI1559791.1 hypothetical protein PtrEW7m1_011766 [Pyrenophora tritici-repentis]PWO19821.1 PAT1 multi-domain protein [Pyrenophora tritici-repentis]
MSRMTLKLLENIRTAFAAFVEDESLYALLLNLSGESELQPLPPLFRRDNSFQTTLNELDGMLTPLKSCYIILRWDGSLVFLTYVPYRGDKNERDLVLKNRHEFLLQLGEKYFVRSMICKEIGEVTDERSWEERDAEQRSKDAVANDAGEQRVDGSARNGQKSLIDAGYKRNKCRLCDRRMKNNISPEALEALAQLHTPSTAVQISVNTSTETLELRYIKNLAIADVAATLPAETPSFTLYRHAITRILLRFILYFIFHSPDTASVQERMMHTMAIPGLINIHA